MFGTWILQVMTPFGQHPATLRLVEEANGAAGGGGAPGGSIESRLGNAPLSNISITGDSFSATVSLDLQGRTYDAQIAGRTESEQMTGTIKVNMLLAPTIKFTGTRAGQ